MFGIYTCTLPSKSDKSWHHDTNDGMAHSLAHVLARSLQICINMDMANNVNNNIFQLSCRRWKKLQHLHIVGRAICWSSLVCYLHYCLFVSLFVWLRRTIRWRLFDDASRALKSGHIIQMQFVYVHMQSYGQTSHPTSQPSSRGIDVSLIGKCN